MEGSGRGRLEGKCNAPASKVPMAEKKSGEQTALTRYTKAYLKSLSFLLLLLLPFFCFFVVFFLVTAETLITHVFDLTMPAVCFAAFVGCC